jgi:hypothetical protein
MLLALLALSAPPDARLYELRAYTVAPGKLDAALARLKDPAAPLLAKHGITLVGCFTPTPNPDNQFYALVVSKDRAARDAGFKAFVAEPAWQKAQAATDASGKLVSSVTEYFLTCTDYSPAVEVTAQSPPRQFELRKYRSSSGNPQAINARFRDHTVKLFAKHGMTNLWYWNLADGNTDTTHDLIYLLAHASDDARKKSFAAFRTDPDWQAALKASEAKAGGSLTAKDGVKSILLTPTEFSPLK